MNDTPTPAVTPTPTPRTDAVASFGCVRDDFARQLERELAEAQKLLTQTMAEREHNGRMVSEYRQQRDACASQLADAIRERDNALSDYRQADTDSIRALYERNEARVQRDALAALAGELIAVFRINYQYHRFTAATTEQIDAYLQPFETRLKAATVEPKS